MRGFYSVGDNLEILLDFPTGETKEETQENFIAAVAKAEIKEGVTVTLNAEGRRRVNAKKAEMLAGSVKQLSFAPEPDIQPLDYYRT